METKSACCPSAGLDCLNAHPAELLEHPASAVYFLGCGELGPVLAVDGAGRVAVAHLSLTDTLQQRSRSLHGRVFRRSVESSSVGLQILTPRSGLYGRPEPYCASFSIAVNELDELEDER